jgi:hypothetical protein
MCGGLIHPIAGRCKHCKGDLSAMRAARPAAVASLPALHANGNVAINPYQAQGPAQGHGQPQPHALVPPPMQRGPVPYAPAPQAAAHAAIPMPMPVHDGSQPVLPPRPTGRMYASAPSTAWWKSWPLIVIVLAMLAIVTAVILMVWPPGGAGDKGVKTGAGAPPPAPDRMDTNPLPPDQPAVRSGDPWSTGGAKPNNAPPRSDDPVPPTKIDIPDDPDQRDDPTASSDPGSAFGGLTGSGAVMISIMSRACKRASTCGALDSSLKDYCEMAAKVPAQPTTCAAAKRCFDQIDQISCSAGFDDLTALQSVTYKLQDCIEAINGGC